MAALEGHARPVTSAVFSPGGEYVLTASADKTARIWEAGSWRSLRVLSHPEDQAILSAAFSHDGRWIATSSAGVRIWDATTGRPKQFLRGSTPRVSAANFSPDGKRVVTVSAPNVVFNLMTGRTTGDGIVGLHELGGGRRTAVLQGHSDYVTSASFSPNGRWVVTSSQDNTARVWEAGSGRVMLELPGHTREVYKAVFGPDGKLVVTASRDRTARIFRCEVCGSINDLLDLARRRATRELTAEERERYLD